MRPRLIEQLTPEEKNQRSLERRYCNEKPNSCQWKWREHGEYWALMHAYEDEYGRIIVLLLRCEIARIEKTGMMYRLFNPHTGETFVRSPILSEVKEKGERLFWNKVLPTTSVVNG